jgi:hypothetical protein
MPTLEQLLDYARRLPAAERLRLVEALGADLRQATTEERRAEALTGWVALAGRFHADSTDVSADKYKHLADAYADER